MSKMIDLLGLAGLGLIAWGLYLWRPCFAIVLAGGVLLWVARTLAASEKQSTEGK